MEDLKYTVKIDTTEAKEALKELQAAIMELGDCVQEVNDRVKNFNVSINVNVEKLAETSNIHLP